MTKADRVLIVRNLYFFAGIAFGIWLFLTSEEIEAGECEVCSWLTRQANWLNWQALHADGWRINLYKIPHKILFYFADLLDCEQIEYSPTRNRIERVVAFFFWFWLKIFCNVYAVFRKISGWFS